MNLLTKLSLILQTLQSSPLPFTIFDMTFTPGAHHGIHSLHPPAQVRPSAASGWFLTQFFASLFLFLWLALEWDLGGFYVMDRAGSLPTGHHSRVPSSTSSSQLLKYLTDIKFPFHCSCFLFWQTWWYSTVAKSSPSVFNCFEAVMVFFRASAPTCIVFLLFNLLPKLWETSQLWNRDPQSK